MESRRLWGATAVMTAGTALSRATGLVRVAAIAYALGVAGTRLADTYNLANTTPNIVYELFLGGVFTAVLVPVIVGARTGKRADEGSLVSFCVYALTVITLLAVIAAPLIMRAYTFRIADPALRAAQQELGAYLVRWFAPQILFLGLSAVAEAQLNVRGRFGPAAFAPAVNNVIGSATLLGFARLFGETTLELSSGARLLLGAGTTAGYAAQVVVLLPLLRGTPFTWRPHLRDETLVRFVRLSGYVVAYVAVNQVGLWVVYALANAVRGGVTAYQIAFMFFQLPYALFGVSLVKALHPQLSAAAAERRWDDYRQTFTSGIRGVAYLLIPAAIGYALLSRPLARLLLAHGVSGTGDAEAVAAVLEVFVAGLVFFAAFQLLRQSFNALLDTRTPTLVNALVVAIWIGGNVPLFGLIGVRGLALAHAVSYVAGAAVLLVALGRRVPGGVGVRTLASPLARMAVAAAGMGVLVWLLVGILDTDLARIAVALPAGVASYSALSLFLGIPELRSLLSLLRRRPASGPGFEAD